jgi:arylsulfatase A-like enzyme
VFPTILELAGLPALNYLHGKSILPILKDQPVQINKYVASESVGVGGKTGMGHRMIRSERWKYISTDINEELLFDLSNDPYEKNNLIDDKIYDSDFNLLKEYYQQWRYLVGDKKSIR